MEKHEKVIGIDLLNNDEGGGMYALCESPDGGDTWNIVENGRQIEALLKIAKERYNEDIPMVLPFQIRELLMYEIVEEREKMLISKRLKSESKTEEPTPRVCVSWWKKLLALFRR